VHSSRRKAVGSLADSVAIHRARYRDVVPEAWPLLWHAWGSHACRRPSGVVQVEEEEERE